MSVWLLITADRLLSVWTVLTLHHWNLDPIRLLLLESVTLTQCQVESYLLFQTPDSFIVSSDSGFVGCVRDLVINQKKFDPRVLLYTANVREISLDNCQLVDPCHRPNACEHGGLCMVDEGRVVCDCTGTGYTGKNCHFGEWKFLS